MLDINKIEQRETIVPKNEFKINFANHGSAKDADYAASDINDADIILLEGAGWNEKVARFYNKISFGQLPTKDSLKHIGINEENFPYLDYSQRMLELIHNTKKPIGSLDVSEAKAIELFNAIQEFSKIEHRAEGSFESMLGEWHTALTKFQRLQDERENEMIRKIPGELKKAYELKPELGKKNKVKVLIQIGSDHFNLAKKMKLFGMEVASTFPNHPMFYNFLKEYMVRTQTEKEITQRDMAKFWLGEKISRLDFPTSDMQKVIQFTRLAMQRFDFDEIKDVYNNIKTKHIFKKNIVKCLKEKGLAFPTTEAEIDQYIKSYRSELFR